MLSAKPLPLQNIRVAKDKEPKKLYCEKYKISNKIIKYTTILSLF